MTSTISLPFEYRHRQLDVWVGYDCPHCQDTKARFGVKYTKQGWYYHCFNCHPQMMFHSVLRDSTPAETLAYLNQPDIEYVREDNDDSVSLPVDFQYHIPPRYREWLDQYKITDEEMWEYRLGYSPSLERLILPSYVDGKLICWQGRALGEKKPKYLTEAVKGQLNLFIASSAASTPLVLVEDIISAIKVGRVAPAIALLGSFVSPKLLTYFNPYDKIILWLDYDKVRSAFKFRSRLSLLSGKKVYVVCTPKDPKDHSTEEIRRHISV